MLKEYKFATAGKIIAGNGTILRLGDLLLERGIRKAALISDPGVRDAGLLKAPVEIIKKAGIQLDVFAQVAPEPTVENVAEIRKQIRGKGYEMFVGIGGGSTLDTTKLLAAVGETDTPIEDFVGIDLIPGPGVPSILAATTAGTGSEVTPNSILTLPDQKKKAGVVSPYLLAEIAILDPSLTRTLPKPITASTGMDALIHSVESYTGNKANPISDSAALHGIRLVSSAIRTAYAQGDDLGARERMIIGSMLGGMALTAAGTAAVHALAYPIGGRYGVPHGVANSMLLVPVTEFNMDACIDRLADVAEAMGLDIRDKSPEEKARTALQEFKSLSEELEIPSDLKKYGCREQDLDELAESAFGIRRLLDNNPKEMPVEEIRKVYASLM